MSTTSLRSDLNQVRNIVLVIFASLLGVPLALSDPFSFSYSGRLIDQSGSPLAGPITLEIKFFNATSGGKQIGPTKTLQDVKLANGAFQIDVGLSPDERTEVFTGSSDTWVQVTEVNSGKTYPRQKISATPYALKIPIDDSSLGWDSSGKLQVRSNASVSKIDGADVTASGATSGQVLSWNDSTKTWEPTDVGPSSITPDSIGATQLAPNAVGLSEIDNNLCIDTQILKKSGGTWVCAVDAGGAGSDIQNGGNALGTPIVVGTNDVQNFQLETNNQPRLTIDTTGNVGIGSIAPTSNFQVIGDAYFGDVSGGPTGSLRVKRSLGAGNPIAEFYYQDSSTNPRLQIQGATNQIALRTGYTTGGSDLVLGTINAPDAIVTKESGKIGLGTTAPDTQLHLYHTTDHATITAETTDGTKNAHLVLKNPAGRSGDVQFWNNSAQRFRMAHRASTDDLVFSEFSGSWQDRLTIQDTTGMVGIGTDDPQLKLHVFGTTNSGDSSILLENSNSTLGDRPIVRLQKARAGSTVVQDNDLVGTVDAYAHDGTDFHPTARIDFEIDGTPGNDDMPGRILFQTTNDGASSTSEKMRLTQNGRLGIGLTNPAGLLDVNGDICLSGDCINSWADAIEAGNISFDGDVNHNMNIVRNPTADTAGTHLTVGAGGATSGATNKDGGTLNLSSGVATGTGGSRINFQISKPGGSGITDNGLATVMTLSSSGYLGIGTTIPNAPLHLEGGGEASSGIILNNTGPPANNMKIEFESGGSEVAQIHASTADGVAGELNFQTAAAADSPVTRMIIDSTGNVGIGTSTPQRPLHVLGGFRFENDGNSTLEMSLNPGNVFLRSTDDAGGARNMYLGASDALTSQLVLGTSGNVGIGTTMPGNKLSIASDTVGGLGLEVDRFSSNGVSAPGIQISKSASDTIGVHALNGTPDDMIGKVIFSPSDGAGGFRTTAGIFAYAGTGGHTAASDMPTYLTLSTTPDGTGTLTEQVRVSENGNVGIGTTAPDARLDIENGSIQIATSGEGIGNKLGELNPRSIEWDATGTLVRDTGNIDFIIDDNNDNTGSFRVYSQGSTRATASELMTVTYAGNVGIGTTSPDTRLHVQGGSSTTLKVVDGNQASGKVLTSDASGNASWQYASGLSVITGSVGGSSITAATTNAGFVNFPGGPFTLSLPSAGTYFISQRMYSEWGSGCGDLHANWAGSNIVYQSTTQMRQVCSGSSESKWQTGTFIVVVSAPTTLTAQYNWGTPGTTGNIAFGGATFIKIGN